MRGIRLITTLAAGALLLGGCGKPGMAAKVGDREFSQNDVAVAAEELPPITGQVAGGPEVVAAMLVTSAMSEAAGEAGVHVSLQEVRKQLQEVGVETAELSDVTVELLSGQLLNARAQALDPKAVEEISRRTDELISTAQVNPRYYIDVENMRPAEAPSWLEVPAAEQES